MSIGQLNFPEVTAASLPHLVDQGYGLIDVREVDEFEAGHIPGSIHIPLSGLQHLLHRLDSKSSYLVVCRSGARSTQAAKQLAERGIKAHNVTGGLTEFLRTDGTVRNRAGFIGRLA